MGALLEVHRHLGPGLYESVYETCTCHELTLRRLSHARQVPLPILYKGALEELAPIHNVQVFTYMKLSGLRLALLVNFNVRKLTHGLRRLWLPPGEARMRDLDDEV